MLSEAPSSTIRNCLSNLDIAQHLCQLLAECLLNVARMMEVVAVVLIAIGDNPRVVHAPTQGG